MAKRATPTRTLHPLPFENLEPHRFEDLIRRLLYRFRDWIDIEPTGRGGSDDGFDIRAWEKAGSVTNQGDDGQEGEHTQEGNLWQVQGKRERRLTPAQIKHIIQHDIDPKKPPHGYILAAATNISKAGYDVFREECKKRGVRQFFFWGKDYLEDQLSLTDNDEALFTFFGISLSPRRRTRTADIKFSINNKNRVLRLLFGSDGLLGHSGVVSGPHAMLLRDIKDQHYPYAGEYSDFDKNRRWEEHDAVQVTPRGVYFKKREWYAYADLANKEWDFTEAIDLTLRKHNLDSANRARLEDEGKAPERYWRHLPQRNQAKLTVYGFVAFDEMLIIDDKGDPDFTDPHVFIDFGSLGPFSHLAATLSPLHQDSIDDGQLDREFKRKAYFPKTFEGTPEGKQHDSASLGIIDQNLRTLTHLRGRGKLYAFDDQMKVLRVGDLIRIPAEQNTGVESYAEVTHTFDTTLSAYRQEYGDWEANRLKDFAGTELNAKDRVNVYEVVKVVRGGTSLIYCDEDY